MSTVKAINIQNPSSLTVVNMVTDTNGSVTASNNFAVSNNLTVTNNITISSNNFFLGTSTLLANGYSYLPNGLKANWGILPAVNTISNAIFTSAFTSVCYGVFFTPQTSNYVGANSVYLSAPATTTSAPVRSVSTVASAANVYYFAIGV